jgi:hypothetical protein
VSDNFNIKIVIFDLTKEGYYNPSYKTIKLSEVNASSVESYILDIIKSEDIYCFTKIKCDSTLKVEPVDKYIDKFNLGLFEDSNIGCIFSDNYTLGVLCHKKSMPVKITDSDLFFIRSSSFTEHSNSDNAYSNIISSMISRYIPKANYNHTR